MEVVITKAQLTAANACDRYLESPEWDADREALVYSDWDATVARHLVSVEMLLRLEFLVSRNLVPMARGDFAKLKRETRKKLRAQESDHG